MNIYGVDTGVKTGLACWDNKTNRLTIVKTTTILRAMNTIKEDPGEKTVYFEDARLRRWFGNKGREALQGAGSIKRDASIWDEFGEIEGIVCIAIAPAANATKLSQKAFTQITGWKGRTSEHSRDAAMLVYRR